MENQCKFCKEGKIVKNKDYEGATYKCSNCRIDSETILKNGIMFPSFRRIYLCSLYTPVKELDVSKYTENHMIEYTLLNGTVKKGLVLAIVTEKNVMAVRDENSQKIYYFVDWEKISNAYIDTNRTKSSREYKKMKRVETIKQLSNQTFILRHEHFPTLKPHKKQTFDTKLENSNWILAISEIEKFYGKSKEYKILSRVMDKVKGTLEVEIKLKREFAPPFIKDGLMTNRVAIASIT